MEWQTIFTADAEPKMYLLDDRHKVDKDEKEDLVYGYFLNFIVNLGYLFGVDQEIAVKNLADESMRMRLKLAVIKEFTLQLPQGYVRPLQPFNGVIGAMPVALSKYVYVIQHFMLTSIL